MGSASFRNCAFTQIAKSWPTLSSDDILRNVLSTHFWPALSTWMGPGCRKRSLLLSLAKQSAAASRSAINSRCRSMQLTIAKTDRDVLQMLALVSWPRDCYDCRCELAGREPGVPARLNGRDARSSTVC